MNVFTFHVSGSSRILRPDPGAAPGKTFTTGAVKNQPVCLPVGLLVTM